MTPPTQPFPTGRQALLLLIALTMAEVAAYAVLRGVRSTLGLSDDSLDALAMLMGHAVVLTAVMQHNGLSFRQLFNPSGATFTSQIGLLVVPVAALVPALVVMVSLVLQGVVWVWPMSAWERALFDRLTSQDVATLTMVCVLAPVLEEMLFRGVMLRSFLARYPRGQAMAGSAILFGVAHLNIYQFFAASILGLVLAWLYERTRSLLPCILLHALYNTLLVVSEESGRQSELPGWADSGASVAVATGVGTLAAWVLWRLLGRSRVSRWTPPPP